MKKWFLGFLAAAVCSVALADVNDSSARVQYTAAVSETEFAYPFEIVTDGDILVYVDGVLQTLSTHYSVAGEGNDAGGTITFVTPLTGGEIVTLLRDTVIARDTDFGQNSGFSSSAFNREFDKLYFITQDLENKVGRAIRIPQATAVNNEDIELEPISLWLGKLVSISSTGVPEPASLTDDGVALSQSLIAETLYGDVGVADGVTDDEEAITVALGAANYKVVFPKGETYALASSLTIPAGLDVDFNGSTIRKTVSDATTAYQMTVSAGATIRNLTFEIPSGVTIKRGITLLDGAKAYNVKVTSVNQLNNAGSANSAFNITGDDTEVIGLYVENIDYGIRADTCQDGHWNNFNVSSYVFGLEIEDCDRFTLSGYLAHTQSSNGAPDPGNNGLIMQAVQFGKVSNVDIRDSAEHCIYLTGGGIEEDNRNMSFSNIQVSKCGQTGFKILNGTERSRDITINGFTATDMHWGSAPGTNEDGMRIERADNVVVTGFSVDSRESSDGSAYYGIYLRDVTNVAIIAPSINDVIGDGIHIADNGLAVTNNSISIVSPHINLSSGNGINIDVDTPSSELRHIVISDAYINNVDDYAFTIDSSDEVILQPVSVSGMVNAAGTGVYNDISGITDQLLNVDLKMASTFQVATGTFTASVYFSETRIDSSAGAVTMTLPNGVRVGQRMTIRMSDADNSSTVSVSTHETSSPEVFTFAQTTDVLVLEWTGSLWYTVKNIGAAT